MKNKALAIGLFTLLASTAQADSQILVEPIPGSLSKADLVVKIQGALTNRQWKIAEVKDSSVVATLEHRDRKCTIEITAETRVIIQQGSCLKSARRMSNRPAGNSQAVSIVAIPSRWITYLKRDLELIMSISAEKPQKQKRRFQVR